METGDINSYALGAFKTIYLFMLMNNFRKTAEAFKDESSLSALMLDKLRSKSLLLKKCKCSKNKCNQTDNKESADHNRHVLDGSVEGGPLQYKTDDTIVFYICDHFTQNEDKAVGCRRDEPEEQGKLHRNVGAGEPKGEILKLRSKFNQLQQEHQKLIAVTSELTTALQMNIVGQTRNINLTLEQCKSIYPSLFPPSTPTNFTEKEVEHHQAVGTVIEEPLSDRHERKLEEWTNTEDKPKSSSPRPVDQLNLQHLNSPAPLRTPLTPDTVRQILETVFTRIFESAGFEDREMSKPGSGFTPQQMEKIVDEVLENIVKSPNTYGAGEGKISRPISAKEYVEDRRNMFNIDYRKIKRDLIDGDKERKIRILQALRWRITKTDNNIRDKMMSAYIQNDILDLFSKISIPERMLMGYSDNCVQESICRLINTLASLRQGRDYLNMDERLLKKVLIKKIKDIRNMSSAVIRNMLVGSMQKLSIRKQCRMRMVSEGLFEILIDYLDEFYDKLSRYCLEYCSALLMNICLVDEAKIIATKMSSKVIQLLKKFILGENECCLPYINGMMFSLLEKDDIVEEAKKQDLDKVLVRFSRSTTNENIRKQVDFIMQSRLFGKSEPINDNDDENQDEVDLLEIELDQDDFITQLPSGEKLLEEYQVEVNNNTDKNQYVCFTTQKTDCAPDSAQSFSEENKAYYQKPSAETGIFQEKRPRRLTTFSQVPHNVSRTKKINFKIGKYPSAPLCYMENCQKYKEENGICSCTKSMLKHKTGGKRRNCKVCGEKKCECAFESRPKICRTPPL
ncbi:hypothetical protein GWI33_013830 [Rhynchophorus ferrugineus]|uniref:LisH domain-containing protein n=1 Tax=Rhynchophorus ferrugineus TaxID=354439 RepID=A0A834M9L5_RHYFE|nr:hypothetical protein GWI33_013830 [Rhynchophorus ferrugineus]